MNFQIHKTATAIGNNRGTNIISQKNDDPNHFDPRYFGENRSYHQPKSFIINNIINNIDFLGENLRTYDVNIFNAGFRSKLESFPRRDFFSLFDKTQKEIKEIFDQLLLEKCGRDSTQFESEFSFIKDKYDLKKIDGKESFFTTKEYGLKLVFKKVNDYIALGPFDNKYFFLIRTNLN